MIKTVAKVTAGTIISIVAGMGIARWAILYAYKREMHARGMEFRKNIESLRRLAAGGDPDGDLIPPVLAQNLLDMFERIQRRAAADHDNT